MAAIIVLKSKVDKWAKTALSAYTHEIIIICTFRLNTF